MVRAASLRIGGIAVWKRPGWNLLRRLYRDGGGRRWPFCVVSVRILSRAAAQLRVSKRDGGHHRDYSLDLRPNLGAQIFSFFVGVGSMTEAAIGFLAQLHWSPMTIMAVILVIHLLLGSLMESFAVVVITVPIVTPLLLQMGCDLLWWAGSIAVLSRQD
jgi:hypothetical protein